MKKAILIFKEQCDDKKAWSGTNFYIFQTLSTAFDLYFLQYKSEHNSFLLSVIKLFRKIAYFFSKQKRNCYPRWYTKVISKKTILKINQTKNIELVFTTCRDLIPLIKNKKVIYICDATFHLMNNYYWFDISNYDYNIQDKTQKLAFLNSYLIVASSDWCFYDITKHYNVMPSKAIVCPFGANLPQIKINPFVEQKKKYNILFCGTDPVRKGLDKAIQIVKKLNSISSKKYTLNVVGINGNNDADVCYYGMLDKTKQSDLEKIVDLYSHSDLFLLPTIAECAGIVFCEASMFAVPIFSSLTGGIPTYVDDGKNGFLFKNDSFFVDNVVNKILEIVDDSNRFLNLKKECVHIYNERLNWDAWLKKLLDSLDNVYYEDIKKD